MGLDLVAYKEYKDGENILADNDAFVGTESLVRNTDDLNSIRGKQYYWTVLDIANVSLYTEMINNTVIRHIADSLEEYKKYQRDSQELNDLTKWFRVCADNGFYVGGSW